MRTESDSSESAHARIAAEASPSVSLPDAIDPELSAAERARLAGGSLTVTQADAVVRSAPLAVSAFAVRRFNWPLTQRRLHWVYIVVVLFCSGYVAWQVGREFIGIWELNLVQWLYILAVLLLLDLLMARAGEQVRGLGRSWVQIGPNTVRMRLFYGRRPRTMGKWFRLRLIWPCRATIRWYEIARVALYRVAYDGGEQVWYWVKLWTHNGTGYVVLITQSPADANQLADLMVQHAQLKRWATLGVAGEHVADPTLGALDRDTLTIWKADQRRMKLPKVASQISAELWRTADGRPFVIGPWLTRHTAVKLIAAIALLLVILNYEYLLSFLLWSPLGPPTSDDTWTGVYHDAGNTNASNQTLIPPLHEAWHAPDPKNEYETITLGGGRLAVIGGKEVNIYNPTSGQLLYSDVQNDMTGCRNKDNSISSDGNYAYYIAEVGSDLCSGSISIYQAISDSYKLKYDLTALDLKANKVIWKHPVGASDINFVNGSPFLLQPQRNMIIASSPISTLQAINLQTGATVWQSQPFTATGVSQIVIGGDTVYALAGFRSPGLLVALDINTGRTRWTVDTGAGNYPLIEYALMADESRAYLLPNAGMNVYARANGDLQSVNVYPQTFGFLNFNGAPALLHGTAYMIAQPDFGSIFANDIVAMSSQSERTVVNRDAANGYLFGLTLSNGLIFAEQPDHDSTLPFIGEAHLAAFDLQSGRQVWRSLPYNVGSDQLVIGNGMLYMISDGEIHAYAGAR